MSTFDRSRRVRLTPLQSILVLPQAQGRHVRSSVLQVVVHLDEADPALILEALDEAVRNEEALQVRFLTEGGEALATVGEAPSAELAQARCGATGIEAWLSEDRGRAWEAGRPPWRCTLVQDEEAKFLVFSTHTALMDRTSAARILGRILSDRTGDREAASARWLAGDALQPPADGEAFWSAFGGAFPPAQPFSVLDGSAPDPRREARRMVSTPEGGVDPTRLQAAAPAALAAVLSYYTGTPTVRFGVVEDLRDLLDDETEWDGPVLATLPLGADLDSADTLRALQEAVANQRAEGRRRGAVSPLDLARWTGGGARPQDVVLLLEVPGPDVLLADAGVSGLVGAEFAEDPPFPVMVYVTETREGVSLTLRYEEGRLTGTTADDFLRLFERALVAVLEQPEADSRRVDLLDTELETWYQAHGTGASSPRGGPALLPGL